MFRGLKEIRFSSPSYENCSKVECNRSSKDDMLDLIYCIDPVTGFPSGAISQYLSDKTNDQVRQFIERNLLQEHNDGDSFPATLREDILKLDGEFISKTCRRRFEDKESYESRLQSYFNEIESDKNKQKEIAKLRKRYADLIK